MGCGWKKNKKKFKAEIQAKRAMIKAKRDKELEAFETLSPRAKRAFVRKERIEKRKKRIDERNRRIRRRNERNNGEK